MYPSSQRRGFSKSLIFEHLLVVAKDVTVTSLACLHVDNSLVGFLHGTLLNPRVDLLVSCQLQHLVDLVRGTNSATADLNTIHDQSEGVDVGKLSSVRSSDLDKSASGLQQGDVAIKRHLSAGNGTDNQVKSAAVVLCPVLVVVGSDVSVGTKLENLVLLACLARDTDNLVGAKGLGEKNTEVTETTDTNNTDLSSFSRGLVIFADS